MREEIRVFGQQTRQHPLRVIMAGTSFCDDTYRISRPDYSYFVIEYVTGGTGILEVGGQRHALRAGDTYFLYPGRAHSYYCTGGSWNKLWVVVEGPLAEAMVNGYLPHRPDVLHGFEIHRNMEHVIQLTRDCAIRYEELCELLALELHKIFIAAGAFDRQEETELHKAVKKRIEEQTEGALHLEDLAAELNYSKNHIINVFRNAYGMTPYAYFLRRRLMASRELLSGTSMPVSAIAETLGFDSPQYFSRCFRREFGISPTQLRSAGR